MLTIDPGGSLMLPDRSAADPLPYSELEREGDLAYWSQEDLLLEVRRLRAIVGWEETTYLEQWAALLYTRDRCVELSAEAGALRAMTAGILPLDPRTDRHIGNLEMQLERTKEWVEELQSHTERVEAWAQGVEAHAKDVEAWAQGVEAHAKDVEAWAQRVEARQHVLGAQADQVVAKAEAFDRIMRLPGARLARRFASSLRWFGRSGR